MSTLKKEIVIRVAALDDAEELLEIYAPYVRETAITFEYEVPSPEEFRERIAHTLEKYPYLVAEHDGKSRGMHMSVHLRSAQLMPGQWKPPYM